MGVTQPNNRQARDGQVAAHAVAVEKPPRGQSDALENCLSPIVAKRDGPSGRGLERGCLLILTVLAVCYTLYFARAILLPVTLAVMMSLVLKPFSRLLARWGVPNVASAALIFVVLSATLTAGATLLAGPANDWLTKAPRSFQEIRTEVKEITAPLVKLQKAKKEVDDMTSLPGEQKPVKVRVEQPPLASQMVNTTGSFLTGSIIALVLLFFLLAAGDRFMEKWVAAVPTWQEKQHVMTLLQEIQQRISSYLAVITVINIGLGAVIAAGLWAIGMPNPLLWGVAAALLNYIPFAGLFFGTGLVFLVALTELPTFGAGDVGAVDLFGGQRGSRPIL